MTSVVMVTTLTADDLTDEDIRLGNESFSVDADLVITTLGIKTAAQTAGASGDTSGTAIEA